MSDMHIHDIFTRRALLPHEAVTAGELIEETLIGEK